MMGKQRIAIAHPGLKAGGSEAPAMALLEMLQHQYDITLVTGYRFERERLNKAYQTAVEDGRIAVDMAPMPPGLRNLKAGDALRGAFFGRHVRHVAKQFDLCISTYNFAPFGRSAIQFIADFSWDDEIRYALPRPTVGLRGLMQAPSYPRAAYLGLCHLVDRDKFGLRAQQQDVVVANSQWTADLLRSRHGISSRVIYPPVESRPYDGDAARSGDFVMLGRIEPDKRIIEAIEVLSRVRARGHRFAFRIIGSLDNSPYSSRVRSLAAQKGDWVHLEGGLYGEEKFSLLARHSYALHMREREAFGIAVAEQVKMGLIPFVPEQCAPKEIVGDPRLCFRDADDAVEIIDKLLRDSDQLAEVRQRLVARAKLFSAERFVEEARTLIMEHLVNKTTV